MHELCKELIFYTTYNVLLSTLDDEEENFKQAKAFKKQFTTFNEGAIWLIDRIPIQFLHKTKQARGEIFKTFRNIDFNNRRNVSDIVEQVMNADQNGGKCYHKQIKGKYLFYFASEGKYFTNPQCVLFMPS